MAKHPPIIDYQLPKTGRPPAWWDIFYGMVIILVGVGVMLVSGVAVLLGTHDVEGTLWGPVIGGIIFFVIGGLLALGGWERVRGPRRG